MDQLCAEPTVTLPRVIAIFDGEGALP
ncbi:hypothetical protein BOS5A_230549 [Bosea sp. EC-HK365B]|nr:hypothetical protein BOS5A_230549 [Bosea sp. EC-HK365B]